MKDESEAREAMTAEERAREIVIALEEQIQPGELRFPYGATAIIAAALAAEREKGREEGGKAYDSAIDALKEAHGFIGDLLIHLTGPPNATEFTHGGMPLTREESLSYTIEGATKFYKEMTPQLAALRRPASGGEK